jgi:hypothetical protein
MNQMKSYMVLTASGAILVLTELDFEKHPDQLVKLAADGLDKFILYQVPVVAVKASYKAHYDHTLNDPKQAGEIKVLDDDGKEIFKNISFKDLSAPIYYEA